MSNIYLKIFKLIYDGWKLSDQKFAPLQQPKNHWLYPASRQSKNQSHGGRFGDRPIDRLERQALTTNLLIFVLLMKVSGLTLVWVWSLILFFGNWDLKPEFWSFGCSSCHCNQYTWNVCIAVSSWWLLSGQSAFWNSLNYVYSSS